MTLKDRILEDLREAMRSKDRVRLGAVRMLLAAIQEREKSGQGSVGDEDVLSIVQKQARQRRDSIEQFRQAGRDDLAEREAEELAVIEAYLPEQLSDEEIRLAVSEVVQRTGASSPADMGRVMGQAMQALRGKADGNRVREAVENLLRGAG